MSIYNIISADSHNNTPRDLYEKYGAPGLRERMPRVESTERGDFWIFEGNRRPAVVGLSAMAGRAFDKYTAGALRFDEVRPGSWDTRARVEDQQIDGLDAEVIYYSGITGADTADLDLRLGIYRAYNDWLADFCAGAPDRLIGLAAIPMWDVELACAEARRAAAKGLKGAIVPSWSPDEAQYHEPAWDPVWSTFEELGLPVSLHLGAKPHWVRLDRLSPAYLAVSKILMAEPLAIMLLGGPLVKHPNLKIVFAEAGIGWLAYMKEWSDNVYRRHRFWTQMDMPELPSHYFERQIHGTFQEDKAGVAVRHFIGVDSIMWASDYPHSDTTWPESRKYIDEHFADVPDAERRKIVAENAARLYGLR
jgi:predicted TIM-barrel fold metal-dependent hydrolase